MRELEINFGPFRLIPRQRLLLEGDRPIPIGNRALTILQILIERAGKIVDKRELTKLVWTSAIVDEANIRVHICAIRRALGDGQNGACYIVNIPGRGYSFAAEVSHPLEVSHADRGLKPTARPTSTLPNFITRLVGRGDAIIKLKAELARERMITILGSGGIGKTSLALAAAPSWSSASSYEVHFADLALVTDPAGVPAAVAAALSTTTIYEDIIGAMLNALHDRRVLIILDNCDHVISATAGLCAALLTGTKDVRILATSREALRIPGEWIHRLAPLRAPPENEATTAAEAMNYPAVQLFVERAVANVDTYELSDEDAPIVANICRRLDGIPLAIEFAAARADILDVRTIAQHLDHRFALLTKGPRNVLPRQQTLRAVIELSCGLLSTDQKIVLRRLSVFAGHFGVDDAIEVASGDGIPSLTVLESLSDLVAKSIVLADVSGHTVSYRLLETTQAYTAEMLTEAGEAEAVRRRHAQRSLSVCRAAKTTGDDTRPSLRQAMADVRTALDWALVRGRDITLGIDLATAATPLFLELALLREHRKYLELALSHMATTEAKPGTEATERAEMALRTAVALAFYYMEGRETVPEVHLRKAWEIARKVHDKAHELKVLWMLYGIAGNVGNYRRELTYAQSLDAVARSSADPMAALRSHRVLARALTDLGQYALAQNHLEVALLRGRAAMPPLVLNAYEIDDWIAGRANLARLLWLRGFPDDAQGEADQCIAEALALGHEQSTCWALAYHLCPVAIWRGDLDRLRPWIALLLERSQRVFEHYHEWGLLYRRFLNGSDAPVGRSERGYATLETKIFAQADLFSTFDERLVGPETLARARADPDIWCAPEIMRAWAHRLVVGGDEAARGEAESMLLQSLDIARRQSAKAWELRTATTLSLRYRRSERLCEARTVLELALNHFTQGHDTRDVRAAVKLLSELGG